MPAGATGLATVLATVPGNRISANAGRKGARVCYLQIEPFVQPAVAGYVIAAHDNRPVERQGIV